MLLRIEDSIYVLAGERIFAWVFGGIVASNLTRSTLRRGRRIFDLLLIRLPLSIFAPFLFHFPFNLIINGGGRGET